MRQDARQPLGQKHLQHLLRAERGTALQRDQRGEFVLVVNDKQMVEQRYITTGEVVGTAIIVTDGLREGESVIVEGLQRVRPGVAVDAVVASEQPGE